jgi:hypothetical protein
MGHPVPLFTEDDMIFDQNFSAKDQQYVCMGFMYMQNRNLIDHV